ncbi:MAG: NUDIX domain-containing protein [Patescibacteria group bacterium]|nr:NUDIX domain-containing protein [Patescibacteria group bacterium]
MADEKKFHVGVKGLIKNSDGKLLLMKEDVSNHSIPTSEYWDLPGGRMSQGELILETLAREIEEETGITEFSEPVFKTAVISNHEIKVEDEVLGLALFVYQVVVAEDAIIRLSHEHLAYDWFEITEAKELLRHKYPTEFTELL